MINMTKEELDSIEELIERKLLMAEVMGGLTSSDKRFINLWNYTMQLQNNWNELKKWLEEDNYKVFEEIWVNTQEVIDKMQELEGNNE